MLEEFEDNDVVQDLLGQAPVLPPALRGRVLSAYAAQRNGSLMRRRRRSRLLGLAFCSIVMVQLWVLNRLDGQHRQLLNLPNNSDTPVLSVDASQRLPDPILLAQSPEMAALTGMNVFAGTAPGEYPG